MKLKIVTFCWCLFLMLPCVGWAQQPCSPPSYDSLFNRNIYKSVEQKPESPEGTVALMKYVAQNVTHPVLTREKGIPEKLFIYFIIESDGTIKDVIGYVIVNGQKMLYESQSWEFLKRMPPWKPGKCNGESVPVKVTIPVNVRAR